MISSKGKIRSALFIVAFISLGTAFLSLSYLNRMVKNFEEVSFRDAKIAELGEALSIKILEARREEKNFIIYSDSTYIEKTRLLLKEIHLQLREAREITPMYIQELDSIEFMLGQYSKNIEVLLTTFQEDPRTLNRLQKLITNYQEELKLLAKKSKLTINELPAWTSDMNISLLAASTKLSTDKAKLFIELRDNADLFIKLTQKMTKKAREALARHSMEGMNYGVKAQRNTLTIILIGMFLLVYLILYLPHKIFFPFRKISKALQAIGRGESQFSLPNINEGDELGELSRSFQKAIEKLLFFNDLKTAKIIEMQRNLHRILEELEESVLLLSPDLQILYLNTAAKSILGLESDIITKPLKDIPLLWEILADPLNDIEKRKRFEFNVKLKKHNLRKKTILVIPSIGNTGKLDSIVILIK